MSTPLTNHTISGERTSATEEGILRYAMVQRPPSNPAYLDDGIPFIANLAFIGRFNDAEVDALLENLLLNFIPEGDPQWHRGWINNAPDYGVWMVFMNTDDPQSLQYLDAAIDAILRSQKVGFIVPLLRRTVAIDSHLHHRFNQDEWRIYSESFPSLLQYLSPKNSPLPTHIDAIENCLNAILVPAVSEGLVGWCMEDLKQLFRYYHYSLQHVSAPDLPTLQTGLQRALSAHLDASLYFINMMLADPVKLKHVHSVMNTTREVTGQDVTVIFSAPLPAPQHKSPIQTVFLVHSVER